MPAVMPKLMSDWLDPEKWRLLPKPPRRPFVMKIFRRTSSVFSLFSSRAHWQMSMALFQKEMTGRGSSQASTAAASSGVPRSVIELPG